MNMLNIRESNLPYLYQQPPIQSQRSSNNPNFKNTLCRNYSKYGFCFYGTKCKFAHGLAELKNEVASCYKTKKCISFSNDGYCKYGEGCNFQHQKSYPYKKISKEYRDIVYEGRHREESRLEEISKKQ